MEEQVQIKDERRMLLKILRTACDYVVDMLNFDRRIRDAGQEIEDLLRWKEERQNVRFYCRRWVSFLLGIPLGIKLAYDLLLFFPSINNFMLTFDSNGPLFVTMNFSFIGVCCVAVIIALHGIQRLLALPRVSAFKKEWEISGVQKLHDLEARRTALVKEKEALVKDQAAAVLKGIDVSKYQYNIDWNAVKASGIDFAIIRVGYRGYGTGALVEDPYFRKNIKGANAAGVKVGLYFYSQAVNETEAVEEASMVIRLIQETGGRVSYPIYFDTEKVAGDTGRADGISRDQRTRNAVAFCNAIQNAGYRAGVYSYASWFYNNLNMASLTGYSIWIAQYRDNLDFKYNYDIWQYTSSGTVPGISTRVDMNVSKLG